MVHQPCRPNLCNEIELAHSPFLFARGLRRVGTNCHPQEQVVYTSTTTPPTVTQHPRRRSLLH
eukprot:1813366-Amphidinium_carterae.1